MSQENVEIVRKAYRAINDGDEEAGLRPTRRISERFGATLYAATPRSS
jgi:hypothetical protein